MKQNVRFQPLFVPVPAGFLHHQLDPAVHPFGCRVAKAVFQNRHDPVQMLFQRAGHTLERLQLRNHHLPVMVLA